METNLRRRLPLVACCVLLACVGLIETKAHVDLGGAGWDARSYWGAWRGEMYAGSVGDPGAYLYSPAFAQVLWPLAHTTWPLFLGTLVAVNAVGLAWLLRPLPLTVAVPLWLAASQEVFSGNVFIPMAVLAVLGMRRPQLWAFAALTKITPCLGPVWFLARGEWSALARAVAGTAAVVAVSVAISPHLWLDWLRFLLDQAAVSGGAAGYTFIPGPVFRLPVALLLVVWAARTDRVWLLPVAMLVATPFIWNGSFALLAAIPRLRAYAPRSLDARPGPGAGPRVRPPSSTTAPTG